MAAEAVAAAFFAADEGILRNHHRRHILKADRGFKNRYFIKFSQPVQHTGAGNGFHQRAALTAHFQQVQAKQGEHLQLGQKNTFFIDNPDAVGVAVSSYTDVGFLLRHHG